MKNLFLIFCLLLFVPILSCTKEQPDNPEQLPEWLQTKITELVPDQKSCWITDVTISEYKRKKYYHVYCGLWSCVYCQFFDEQGNRPSWTENEWNDFLANQKVIKTLPACN
jgi:hypothetical protein